MKLKKIALGALAVVAIGGTAGWFSLDKETRGLIATVPTNKDLLFWSQPQRDAAFRALDRISLLAKWHDVPAGNAPSALPPGPPLKLPLDVDAYLAGQRSAALIVLHDGKLRLERYGLDFDAAGRWTSFSVAKSITSTLVGAALKDGSIKSMDDKVSDYIPEMKGSAYDDVSIRQLLTMTSGVKWNEDYADPKSDVARFNNHQTRGGRGCAGELHAQTPARGAAGHPLALQHWRDQPGGHSGQPGRQEAAGGLPVGKNLETRRHGTESHLDPEQDRPGNQRLLHPGRATGLRALRPVHPERRDGGRQVHRARRLAGAGHHHPRAHRPARARLRLPVVDL
jgi:hypothetical protein